VGNIAKKNIKKKIKRKWVTILWSLDTARAPGSSRKGRKGGIPLRTGFCLIQARHIGILFFRFGIVGLVVWNWCLVVWNCWIGVWWFGIVGLHVY